VNILYDTLPETFDKSQYVAAPTKTWLLSEYKIEVICSNQHYKSPQIKKCDAENKDFQLFILSSE